MKLNNPLSIKLIIPAIMTSFGVHAAQPATKTDEPIEQISVYGKGYRSTGTKSTLKPMEAPMSIKVLDQALLQLRQADTVNKALRYVSGITPESRATATIFDQYTIRGFESYRNYYDGLPLQSNGVWNLYPQVDAFASESIEILKGPTSVLYGSAPPGGMVNQIAKTPDNGNQTQIKSRLGNNALRELALDTQGSLNNPDLNYRLIALGRTKDSQQKTTEEKRITIAPSLQWQASADTSLTVSAYYQDDHDMIPSTSLPSVGLLYEAPYGRLKADAYAGDVNWTKFDRTITMIGYKLNHQLTDTLSLLQNYRYTDGEALQRNTYTQALLEDQTTLVRSAYFTDEKQHGFVVDNQLAGQFDNHSLLFGFDYQVLDSSVSYGDTLGNDTPTLNLANPDHQQFDIAALPLDFYTEKHQIEQKHQGFYLQDEIKINALTLLVGGRYDKYKSTDSAQKVYAGSAYGGDTDINQENFSGRFAALYALENGFSPYFNYAESFEPTTGVDSVTEKAFKPTTAKQFEAGLKFHNEQNDIQFSAAWFDLRKQNVVVNTADFAKKTQNGEVKSVGIEMELTAELSQNLTLLANYSHLDIQITKNELDPNLIGKTPVWVADQTASLWANYYFDQTALRGLMIGGGIRYVGESAMDKENSDTVPAYSVIDLTGLYDLEAINLSTLAIKLTLSVNNLTGKEYVGACWDKNNCWMGAERTVEAGLSIQF